MWTSFDKNSKACKLLSPSLQVVEDSSEYVDLWFGHHNIIRCAFLVTVWISISFANLVDYGLRSFVGVELLAELERLARAIA